MQIQSCRCFIYGKLTIGGLIQDIAHISTINCHAIIVSLIKQKFEKDYLNSKLNVHVLINFVLQKKSEKDLAKVTSQIEDTREKLDSIVPRYEQLKEREQQVSAQ